MLRDEERRMRYEVGELRYKGGEMMDEVKEEGCWMRE